MKIKALLIGLVLSVVLLNNSVAQQTGFDEERGCVTNSNGQCQPNTILTAVPFLRIVPDARSAGLGDSGIATSPDQNSMHFNSSKLVFVDKRMSFSASYTPWLRNLGLNDVNLAYLSGFLKVDDFQALGFGLRYFNLGEIQFTDINGNNLNMGNPRELEFGVSYNRKLGTNLAAGLSAKYIFSDLASGQNVGVDITAANALAADLSVTWQKEGNLAANGSLLRLGAAITNIGSKVTYTQNQFRDFMPANLGIGGALELNFDDYNSITINADINKLLVPTPVSSFLWNPDGTSRNNPAFDENGNGNPDYAEQSIFGAVLGSFGDAQGGFSEEIQEFNYSLGVEYWYSKQFAVRAGYYYENPLKGNRQFLTVGFGLLFNVFGLDISYLVPTNNQRNPLDNTLRFTVKFDFEALTGESE